MCGWASRGGPLRGRPPARRPPLRGRLRTPSLARRRCPRDRLLAREGSLRPLARRPPSLRPPSARHLRPSGPPPSRFSAREYGRAGKRPISGKRLRVCDILQAPCRLVLIADWYRPGILRAGPQLLCECVAGKCRKPAISCQKRRDFAFVTPESACDGPCYLASPRRLSPATARVACPRAPPRWPAPRLLLPPAVAPACVAFGGGGLRRRSRAAARLAFPAVAGDVGRRRN